MRLNATLDVQRASADRDVNDVANDSRKSVARLQQELDLARQRGACVPTTIRPTRRGRNFLRGKFVAHGTRSRPQRALTKVVFSQRVKFHGRDSRTRTMPDADLGPPVGHRQCPQRGRLGQGWCAGRLVARGHSAKGGPYPVRAPSMRRDEKWSRPPIDPGGRGPPGDPAPCAPYRVCFSTTESSMQGSRKWLMFRCPIRAVDAAIPLLQGARDVYLV